jgi:dihydrofolate synthase / folylpolyglutamate synthase
MTFRQACSYLGSFVNYEKRSAYPYKRSFKLERMRLFLSRIGAPQESFKSIHVAGTKGKGSVCIFCSHILREAGLRVGLYTSPHLNDIRERIRILEPGSRRGAYGANGSAGTRPCADFEGMISKAELSALVARFKPEIDAFCASSPLGPLSFFEAYTALAFAYFKERRVDCAVLETGLGGTLDATNVVTPAVSCITSISLDHTQILGKTLAAIAREKAGIIKPSVPVISAPQGKSALSVLEKRCRRAHAPLCVVNREINVRGIHRDGTGLRFGMSGKIGELPDLSIRLLGEHQAINAACGAALALTAVGKLKKAVTVSHVRKGLARASWPGRFEIFREGFVLDGAHNGASAKALAKTLRESFPGERITMIIGVSRDKDLSAICRQFLRVSREFIVTRADNPRAFSTGTIAARLKKYDPGAVISESRDIAGAIARARAGTGKRIYCVTGSLFLVGEARAVLTRKITHA